MLLSAKKSVSSRYRDEIGSVVREAKNLSLAPDERPNARVLRAAEQVWRPKLGKHLEETIGRGARTVVELEILRLDDRDPHGAPGRRSALRRVARLFHHRFRRLENAELVETALRLP